MRNLCTISVLLLNIHVWCSTVGKETNHFTVTNASIHYKSGFHEKKIINLLEELSEMNQKPEILLFQKTCKKLD